MPQEYNRSSIGATSGSQPMSSQQQQQPKQAYQVPYTAVLEQKNQELTHPKDTGGFKPYRLFDKESRLS